VGWGVVVSEWFCQVGYGVAAFIRYLDVCVSEYVSDQTSRSLNIRFQEHIRYIRYNNPQLAYTLHILQNQNEYGQTNSTLTLLKPLNNPSLLLPYEQYYIQSLHQAGRLIPEQSPGETNPLFQMVINPQPPHPT